MKKEQITREVFRTKMHGFDGYAIMSPDGDLDKFYPALIREPETIGCTNTAEISTEFSCISPCCKVAVCASYSSPEPRPARPTHNAPLVQVQPPPPGRALMGKPKTKTERSRYHASHQEHS